MEKGVNIARKDCDHELVAFITEHNNSKESIKSFYTLFVIEHAISYLDDLYSLRFDLLPDSDKSRVKETMNLVVRKTTQLQDE
jgi:hypothetical protein